MIPVELPQRRAALQADPSALAALRADAEASVVHEEFASDNTAWLPDHPLLPPPVRTPLERYPDEAAAGAASRRRAGPVRVIGLDADGRPRVIRDLDANPPVPIDPEWADDFGPPGPPDDHVLILTPFPDGGLEIVEPYGEVEPVNSVEWRYHDDVGRIVRAAFAGEPGRGGPSTTLRTFRWEGDTCTVALDREHDGYLGGWRGGRYDGSFARGELCRVELRTANWSDTLEELDEALATATHPYTVWRRSFDAPEPAPLAAVEAEALVVAALVESIARAIETAPEVAVPRVVAVALRLGALVEPRVVLLGADELADASGRRQSPAKALTSTVDRLHRDAWDDLLETFDDEQHHAWRSWRQRVPLGESTGELGRHLQVALDALPESAHTLLYVSTGLDGEQALDHVRATRGQAHIDQVLAGVDRPAYPAPTRRPRSEQELAEALEAWNVPTDDLLLFDTRMGGALVAADGPRGTRLGGLADLPDGTPWPTVDGRELTHVCSIDMAEVPREVGALLPREGVLSVFLDLSEQDDAFWEGSPQDDPRAQLFWVEPGAPTHRPAPVNEPRDAYYPPALLPELPLAVEPFPCLPRPQDLAAELEPDEDERLGSFLDACEEIDPELHEMQHVLLGTPWSHQDVLPDDGEIPLLHIAHEPRIDFSIADLADITVYITVDALMRRAWDETRFSINF